MHEHILFWKFQRKSSIMGKKMSSVTGSMSFLSKVSFLRKLLAIFVWNEQLSLLESSYLLNGIDKATIKPTRIEGKTLDAL